MTLVQVGGFSNGSQRGFRMQYDAQATWDHALANGTVGPPLSYPTKSVRATADGGAELAGDPKINIFTE